MVTFGLLANVSYSVPSLSERLLPF
jgi:hypothetical protein